MGINDYLFKFWVNKCVEYVDMLYILARSENSIIGIEIVYLPMGCLLRGTRQYCKVFRCTYIFLMAF